jgi:phosphate transport system substrate-binding protein
MKKPVCVTALLLLVLLTAGCGRTGSTPPDTSGGSSNLSGTVSADGSSTVGPLTTAAAERFRRQHPKVRITVGISGTGGGFERFCNGETDLSDASRPIKDEEKTACRRKGIEYVEFQVANDGISVVVNDENTWADCLTVAQLRKIWQPGSKVNSWSDLDPRFPNVELKLYGPGTDSGTFDFFTDQIVGEEGASRSDYSATENDNVTVQGVSGEKGALGYFGLSYFEDNQEQLKALKINGGGHCVVPTTEAVQTGTYKPLSRPLFIYAKKTSFERAEVKAFLRFIIENEREIATSARFVPLTDAQAQQAEQQLQQEGA